MLFDLISLILSWGKVTKKNSKVKQIEMKTTTILQVAFSEIDRMQPKLSVSLLLLLIYCIFIRNKL